MENKDFELKLNIDEFKDAFNKIHLLRSNIKKVFGNYDLTKEEIMEICDINQSQYYRRLNENPPFSDRELLMILDAILKK